MESFFISYSNEIKESNNPSDENKINKMSGYIFLVYQLILYL